MKKIVVLTGSGISRESGIKTFRETGGLWESYDVTEVASPQGWAKDKELVLKFYNERRAQLKVSRPYAAHTGLAELEEYFDVHIITQNVDNLHERAGSKNILHLHGMLTHVRSTGDPELVYVIGYKEVNLGDKCEKGFQLSPHIVWFGEAVPAIEEAAFVTSTADIFVVVGTALVVYPAAQMPVIAKRSGAKLIIFNLTPTPHDHHADIVVNEKTGETLSRIVTRVKEKLQA